MTSTFGKRLFVCFLAQFLAQGLVSPAHAQDPRALLRRRVEAVQRAYKESMDLYREGRTRDVDRIYRWSQRWLEAEQESNDKKADRIAAAENHLRRMKQLEDLVRNVYKAGAAAPIELPAVEYYRLDAEVALSKAKGP
jgi:hypothetical protein